MVGPMSKGRAGARRSTVQASGKEAAQDNLFYIVGIAIVAVAVFGFLGFD